MTDKPSRILIVEDDRALNQGLVLSLKNDSYMMLPVFSLMEARAQLLNHTFDLIVLDVNLPDGSGLELCREIRRHSAVPIIFLTANDMEMDEVVGLESGGDDYITKPFSLAVLRARIAALLRRSQNAGLDCVKIDAFTFDFDQMVFLKDDAEITLSKTEQKLLRLLISNRGATVPRELLLEKVWGDSMDFVDENALSVTIRRLRGKLEDNASKPVYIQTVYGLGYTWAVK
ncbi:response regulator transcription factor [Eubacterium sp. 1001713B170207_170306_E7]|uniref:response regulator transcription factor n=1 Tax=Eubacterium sp. 1001713B170207_170306_E7 TaxID=2787097 RepID=UPI001898129D|nr:response regulator transcription factor [Eubacterium sp. 1001713B170207_170306_E7]